MSPALRHSIPHDDLVKHLRFVHGLAFAIVGDSMIADDVTQETMLAAVKQPPMLTRGLKAWLGGVVRNKIRLYYRSESRRTRRENQVGGDVRERLLQSRHFQDGLELVEMRRRIFQSVVNLPAHYRDVIVWRYLEERTPTEIASVTGLPISTIRTRLQRGLQKLRAGLEKDTGELLGCRVPSSAKTFTPPTTVH